MKIKQYFIRIGNKTRHGVSEHAYKLAMIELGIIDNHNGELVPFVAKKNYGDDVDFRYEGYVEEVEEFKLPTIEAMSSFPAEANPFNYDEYHMGCDISGSWMAMYSGHYGIKPDNQKTEEEKMITDRQVFRDDPQYIILVSTKTGQRFKINFPKE